MDGNRLKAIELMQRAKMAIVSSRPEMPLNEIIGQDREAFSGIRMLYASDIAGTPLQSLIKSDDKSVAVHNIFCGSGFLAFSDEIEHQMHASQAKITYPVRVLLDTNFLTDMPKLLRGEDFTTRESMIATLNCLSVNLNKSFDWTFAALENVREVVRAENPWPYQKVMAAKLFDSSPTIEEAIELCAKEPGLNSASLIDSAEEHWDVFLQNRETWKALSRRDVMYCVMLRTMLESWAGSSVEQTLRVLIEFCLNSFKVLPLKELYFGWKAAQGFALPESRLKIFDEPALKSPKEKSIKRIGALAWDFFFFRWCETLLSEFKKESFFVPAVTSFDQGLLNAIEACPLRAVLINDEAQLIEAIFDDEYEFQICMNRAITPALHKIIIDPVRRSKKPNISRYKLSFEINRLETAIRSLI
ncbi:hypothetical protein H8K38_06220 [Undibacterium sp. FT79W]|uniref:hypothetical protein n=1 Tax=Undibacterium sp. FT79W TaxID=2762296 RepID=UPI00164AC39A|nr:hypothetical protein [Undibacterium sp. FT79W]MBC3877395.1 hypothetical protein [Undibacterium sp. FT79W]